MGTVSFSSGAEIAATRVQEIFQKIKDNDANAFQLTPVVRHWDVDGLGLGSATALTTLTNSNGIRIGFHARSYAYSDGIRGHVNMTLGAVTCGEDNNTTCGESASRAPDEARSGREIPRNQHPTAFYSGDMNGDGLIDFMSVLPDGAAIVFYQQS